MNLSDSHLAPPHMLRDYLPEILAAGSLRRAALLCPLSALRYAREQVLEAGLLPELARAAPVAVLNTCWNELRAAGLLWDTLEYAESRGYHSAVWRSHLESAP